MVLVVKNLTGNAGGARDAGSIPESGRFPGGGHGNPLQRSCLENPMDSRGCWAAVHSVTQNWIHTEQISQFMLKFSGLLKNNYELSMCARKIVQTSLRMERLFVSLG